MLYFRTTPRGTGWSSRSVFADSWGVGDPRLESTFANRRDPHTRPERRFTSTPRP